MRTKGFEDPGSLLRNQPDDTEEAGEVHRLLPRQVLDFSVSGIWGLGLWGDSALTLAQSRRGIWFEVC